jgi:hypothetical protein
MTRQAIVGLTLAMFALLAACSADRVGDPRGTLHPSGGSYMQVPCDEDPSQPACNPSGGSSGQDTTLMPLCSDAGGAHAASTTPASDTSIAVTVDGPLFIRSCRGQAVWHATASGNSGTVHYKWYYSVCNGLYNYCGAGFGLAQEGDNLTEFRTTLTGDIRTFWVYVEASDLGGNRHTGVSNKMFTKGPAWGADGGNTFNQPCFVTDYPFAVAVDKGFDYWVYEYTVDTWPYAYLVQSGHYNDYNWFYYSRNYCNGNREWNPQTGSPTTPAGSNP